MTTAALDLDVLLDELHADETIVAAEAAQQVEYLHEPGRTPQATTS